MSISTLLIGDIGGTNARFALADAKRVAFTKALTLNCADHATAIDAIQRYLKKAGVNEPVGICLAGAGPVIDDAVRLTNNHWLLDAAELRHEFAAANVRLLNDFEAVAYSIPHLRDEDLSSVGGPADRKLGDADFTLAAIGPGTGLGTGGLWRRDNHCYPVIGEGGHVSFAPETKRQLQVLGDLRNQFERVMVEHLISGPGLENIHRALHHLDNVEPSTLSAQEIFDSAISTGNYRAIEAVQLFFEILGQVAGDLALTLGAVDGVYIAGGIVRRYPEALQRSDFRARFESKGSHRELMERTPTRVVTYPEPGLLGAAACVRQMMAGEVAI